MSHIYTSADQLIGRTPLLELTHLEKKHGLKARILAKLEQQKRVVRQLTEIPSDARFIRA